MFFRKSKAKLTKTRDFMIKGQIIDLVDATKFLGFHIDACLSWRHHIQNTRNKIAKGLGIICKARKVLQKQPYWRCIIHLYFHI